MLVALMIFLFYGHGAGATYQFGELTLKYLKPELAASIPDESRRERALKALHDLTGDIEDLNEQVQKDLGKFEELVRDYDSKPDDFDRLFESRSADALMRVDRVWAGRASLLRHLRPAEWKACIDGARAAAARDAEARSAKVAK